MSSEWPEHTGDAQARSRASMPRRRSCSTATRPPARSPISRPALSWDPGMLVISAYRKLGVEAKPEQIRAYLAGVKGWAGINGVYDFEEDAATRARRHRLRRHPLERRQEGLGNRQQARRRASVTCRRRGSRHAPSHSDPHRRSASRMHLRPARGRLFADLPGDGGGKSRPGRVLHLRRPHRELLRAALRACPVSRPACSASPRRDCSRPCWGPPSSCPASAACRPAPCSS